MTDRGYAKPHETTLECALRESWEESGVAADRGSARFLGVFEKPGGFGTPDNWVGYAMTAAEGVHSIQTQEAEIEVAEWFPLSQARTLVKWEFVKRLLEGLDAQGRGGLALNFEAAGRHPSTLMVTSGR